MKKSKIGLLGAVVALAAVVGVGFFATAKPANALHTSTKVCTPAGVNQVVCQLSLNNVAGFLPADAIPVTFAGPNAANLSLTSATVTSGCAGATITGLANVPGGFTVNTPAAGCAGSTSIVVTENITITGAPGLTAGGFIQAVGPSALGLTPGAPVATGPGNAPLVIPFAVALPTGATKACAVVNPDATLPAGQAFTGQTVNCTITFAPAGGVGPGAVTLAITSGNATITSPNPVQCGNQALGIPCTTVTETFNVTGAGAIVQSVTLNGVTFPGVATGITGVASALQPNITFAGCQVPPLPFVVGLATLTSINPGQGAACRINFSDAGPNTAVSTGLVTITLAAGTPNGITLSAPGAGTVAGANSITVRCDNLTPGTVNANGCTFVDFLINSLTTVPLNTSVSISVAYDPDVDAANTSRVVNFGSIISIVQGIAGFVQPTGFVVTCTGAAPSFAAPGEIPLPGAGVLAVGLLPAGVPCTVTFTNGAGVRVAPGTIEVSALSGTLVDLSGNVTTNLRIGCGDPFNVAINQPIGGILNVNNCLGVRFAVIGLGVGNAEVRLRYEPSTAAAIAGIIEIEDRFFVQFVAPVVTINLVLTVNPVGVGATGIARAEFNRTFDCGAFFGVATTTLCINPSTGLALSLVSGTILNGTVVFATENAAIAAFSTSATQPIATTATGINTAVAGTVSTVSVRCGAFSNLFGTTAGTNFVTTGLNTTAVDPRFFGSYFGGCTEASATYVGINPGATRIAATFIADLPGATTAGAGLNSVNINSGNFFLPGAGVSTQIRTLEVAGAPATGNINLVRGCNNVTPTVTESASAYAGRVKDTSVTSIWEYQTASGTFLGFSPSATAVSDLQTVTRLRPVFVCVPGPGRIEQPPA